MPPKTDTAQVKRELRLQIARQRRRIDRKVQLVQREAVHLVSWQTYLGRFPVLAVTLLGAGLTALVSLRRKRWPQALELRLFRRVGGLLLRRLVALFGRWSNQEPSAGAAAGNSSSRGGDHGGD
jgi:hypothetical protein